MTAGGVETRAALDILRAMDCDKAQSFLFRPPVEPALARNTAGWSQKGSERRFFGANFR